MSTNRKSDFIAALKDREYQDRRNKMLFENLENDEEKIKRKLIKLYKSEGSKLDKQIAQYYTIYGKDNVIEYRVLLQRLPVSERDLLIKDIDTFVNKYPQFENVKAVRESIYKLDRLEGLRVSIEMQQMELAGKEKELIEKHLIDTYGKGVMDSLNRLGHGTNFNTFDKNVVRKFINEKWIDGKSLSNRIYNNRSKVAKYIVTQFRSGVIRGDTYRDLSNSLIGKFSEVSSKQAMRLIRTEGTRVMNEATISTFEKEFEEYRYSAIFDDRTSQICKSLDGRVFKMKDRQAGVNFPPMHANCRSSYDIEVPKNWMELAQEKAREDTEHNPYEEKEPSEKTTIAKTHKKMYNSINKENKNSIIKELENQNVEYKKVYKHFIKPTESNIIKNIGGGDLTKGSCSSLAFAYAGNKAGLNVRDFRGGKSCLHFSKLSSIKQIAELPGVKSFSAKEYNDYNAVLKLIQNMDVDKEYYLATGGHAAVIRQTSKGLQYLELQSNDDNGFKPLNNSVLNKRFGCKKSHTVKYVGKVKAESVLIDIDTLKGNSEFKQILGYINTNKRKQLKGAGGSVK